MSNQNQRIYIYDTTLRDGAQGEGISFSSVGKLRLAERLNEFGFDYIEGGFAGSNEKDMKFFEEIKGKDFDCSKVAAFSSTRRVGANVQDDMYIASLIEVETPVVTVFGKAWKLHVTDVLGTTVEENLAMISDTVSYLKGKGKEVIFDAEHFFDGLKDDPEMAMAALRAAEEAGADVLVLCDTNGGCLSHEIYEMTAKVVSECNTQVGIHVHNDMGLAVANSLEAVRAGATHVQGTINGYGERCGNADLLAIVASLELKMEKKCLKEGSLERLRELSLFVDDLVNLPHNSKLPYVGNSAFSHKAGAHVDAVNKNKRSFEHIEPGLVGNERRMLVSELSGRSGVLMKAVELGVGLRDSKEDMKEVLDVLKDLESKGYAFEAADASFKILIQKVLKEHKSFFELEGFRVIVDKRGKDEPCVSEATIKVRVNDEIEQTAAEAVGPVDALNGALRKALVRFYPEIANVCLTDYRVRILDPEEASSAHTRVLIESTDGEQSWGTVGVSENIIEASWEALLDSVEYKLFMEEEKSKSGEAASES